MTDEEFIEQNKKLDIEYSKQKRALAKQYAYENNKINEGDIIEDHVGKIRVESFGLLYKKVNIEQMPFPQLTYSGIVITKKGTESKTGARRTVFFSNMKKK